MNSRLGILPLVLALSACSQANPTSSNTNEAWNARNDPMRLRADYERTLARLPLEGTLTTAPWSDTYWPSQEAGISNRWREDGDPFAYTSPTFEALTSMSLAQRSTLSPAEKFDALTGNFDYPLVARERRRTSPNNAAWEGICHGWAPAAINFTEPKPVLATGANGLEIPFGSSDIKALLSYYQGEISKAPAKLLGSRCNADLSTNPEAATNPECRDTNAGAFHVIIANQLGIRHEGFVADVSRDVQVWNQPVYAFTSKVTGYQPASEGAAPGTVQEALIETSMRYTVEILPNWNAVNGTPQHSDGEKVYSYRVELNDVGQIIGGEWLTEDRPDFVWTKERPQFKDYYAPLAALYDLSQTAEPLADPR